MVADDPESFSDLDGHVPGEPQDEFDVAEAAYAHGVNEATQASSEKKQKDQQSSTNQQSAQGQQKTQTTDNNKKEAKSVGDHVFVKVSSGVGLGVGAKVGLVKAEAEVAIKSEGEYTLSGKATTKVVEEAHVSGKLGPVGATVGHTSEDTREYDHLTGNPIPTSITHTDHPFVEINGPGGTTASSDRSFTIEVNVCLGFCLGVGVGVR